jgi:hypothetical protein
MRLIVDGIEHVFDDNGICQLHDDLCSMASSKPENE